MNVLGLSLARWLDLAGIAGMGLITVALTVDGSASAAPGGGGGGGGGGGEKGGKSGKSGKSKGGKSKGGKSKGGKDPGVGPFAKDDYPLQERLRPLTLPAGMVELDLAGSYAGGLAPDIVSTGLGLQVGLVDELELGIASGLILSPDVAWVEVIAARVQYLAYDSQYFDFAPSLTSPIGLYTDAPQQVVLGADSRYVFGDSMLFAHFGEGLIPIGLSPGFSLSLSANGGIGWQVGKPTVLLLNTSLGTVTLTPSVVGVGFWDAWPVSLTLQYTPDRIVDLGLTFAELDVLHPDAAYSFTGFARFRF